MKVEHYPERWYNNKCLDVSNGRFAFRSPNEEHNTNCGQSALCQWTLLERPVIRLSTVWRTDEGRFVFSRTGRVEAL